MRLARNAAAGLPIWAIWAIWAMWAMWAIWAIRAATCLYPCVQAVQSQSGTEGRNFLLEAIDRQVPCAWVA